MGMGVDCIWISEMGRSAIFGRDDYSLLVAEGAGTGRRGRGVSRGGERGLIMLLVHLGSVLDKERFDKGLEVVRILAHVSS